MSTKKDAEDKAEWDRMAETVDRMFDALKTGGVPNAEMTEKKAAALLSLQMHSNATLAIGVLNVSKEEFVIACIDAFNTMEQRLAGRRLKPQEFKASAMDMQLIRPPEERSN